METKRAIEAVQATDQRLDRNNMIDENQVVEKITRLDVFLNKKRQEKLQEMKGKLSADDYRNFEDSLSRLQLNFDDQLGNLEYKLKYLESEKEEEYKALIESFAQVFGGMEEDIKQYEYLLPEKEEITSEELLAKVKEFSYTALAISEETYENGRIKQLVKGVVDTMVIENLELAQQVYETKGLILVDMLKTVFSWEGIKQIAKGLGESVRGLFSGDIYKTGRSIGELGLLSTGAGMAGWGMKKAAKTAMRRAVKIKDEAIAQSFENAAHALEGAGNVLQSPSRILVDGVKGIKDNVIGIDSARKKIPKKEKPVDLGSLDKEFGYEPKAIRSAIGAVKERFSDNPKFANILIAFLKDTNHKMNINEYLINPEYREIVMKRLEEIASEMRLSQEGYVNVVKETQEKMHSIFDYNDEALAEAVLFNRKMTKMQAERMKKNIVLRGLYGISDFDNQTNIDLVKSYANRMATGIMPEFKKELDDIVSGIDFGDFKPLISVRAKSGDGLIDKIQRMSKGNVGREARDGYCLADVPDAVGGRITVGTLKELQMLVDAIESKVDKGRIIEKDNFYFNPKKLDRPYRVITYIIGIGEEKCEIQLTTLNASLVADLDHNIVYKPIIDVSEAEKEYVKSLARVGNVLDLQNI